MKSKINIILATLLVCSFLPSPADGQWNGELNAIGSVKVDFQACKLVNTLKAVTEVEIEDRRPDTGCIGFQGNFTREAFIAGNNIYSIYNYERLVTNIPLTSSLANTLAQVTRSNSTTAYGIRIVLREFWINDYILNYNRTNIINSEAYEGKELNNVGGILIKADILLKRNDQLIPLRQLDTVISVPRYVRRARMEILNAGLDVLVSYINELPLEKYYSSSKRAVGESAIDSFYRKTLFREPIYLQNLPADAIFSDAISLKNLQASSTTFIIEQGKRKECYIYDTLHQARNQVFPHAYTRKGELYILTNHVYCRAYKIGNKFYMYAPKISLVDSHENITKLLVIGTGSRENKIVPVHQFVMYDPLTGFFW